MTSDTTKSLGYLKKSLKMSKRAIEKNGETDLGEITKGIDILIDEIEKNTIMTPAPPAPPAPVTPATSIPTAIADDNLLTT